MSQKPLLKPPAPIFGGAAMRQYPPERKGMSRGGAGSDLGPLSQRDFFLLCGLLMVFMGALNFFLPRQIDIAKAAGIFDRVWLLHGVCIVVNAAGFWYATRLFLRRFQDILGGSRLPFFTRSLFRFSLLSPLLSAQFLVLALALPRAPRGGPRGRWAIAIAFVLMLVVGHGAYLTWRMKIGRAVYVAPETRFKAVIPGLSDEQRALRELVRQGSVPEEYRSTVEDMEVHVLPYLNPSLRVGIAAVRDFLRVGALDEFLSGPRAKEICSGAVEYLGARIDNCFFASYEALGEFEPFISPAPALFFENRRRGAKRTASVEAVDPSSMAGSDGSALALEDGKSTEDARARVQQTVATGLAAIENMVVLLDPNHHRLTVRQATYPVMLLPLLGNAEIPLLELVRDVQQFGISRMIVKTLAPRIVEMRQQFEQIKRMAQEQDAVLSGESLAAYTRKLDEIEARLGRLRERPFALTAL